VSGSKNPLSHTPWRRQREGGDAALSGVDELFGGLGVAPASPRASVCRPPVVTPEQSTRETLQELGITPVEVVADFLANIRETTLASIKRSYPMERDAELKVEWILTVPAIWTDAAKNLMIQAATQAKLGVSGVDFELISEPECGATHALNVIQRHDLAVCASSHRSLSWLD